MSSRPWTKGRYASNLNGDRTWTPTEVAFILNTCFHVCGMMVLVISYLFFAAARTPGLASVHLAKIACVLSSTTAVCALESAHLGAARWQHACTTRRRCSCGAWSQRSECSGCSQTTGKKPRLSDRSTKHCARRQLGASWRHARLSYSFSASRTIHHLFKELHSA